MDLNKLVVRAGGLVDVGASLEAVETALTAANAAAEQTFAAVGPAVDAVFAASSEPAITIPALVTFAINELGIPASQHKATEAAIKNYIRANSSEGGKYLVKKGKGGGVSLRK